MPAAYFALAVLFAANLLSYVDRQIINLMVDPIKRDLGISDFEIGLLQGWAFSISYALMGLPIAVLADRTRRTTIIGVGIFFWTVMTSACGLAKSFVMLFLARLGVGLGEATLAPASTSLLADYYAPKQLARVLAIFALGVPIGAGLSYMIGGAVINAISDVKEFTILNLVTLKPWQMAFVIVSLPGLLIGILAFLIREPKRKGIVAQGEQNQKRGILSTTAAAYLREKWKVYLSFIAGITIFSAQAFGFMAWYPTVLIRTYGLTIGEAGAYFGLIYVLFGTVGILAGPLVVERMVAGGVRDAHVRYIIVVAWVSLALGIFCPIVPDVYFSLGLLSAIIFLKSSYLGVELAAIQLITPNQYRAQMAALLSLFVGLFGMGFGASIVAAFTDFVFQDPTAVGYSLASASTISVGLAIMVLTYCLRHYRREIEERGVFNA